MDATTVIAIYGAVVATAGALFKGVELWRERGGVDVKSRIVMVPVSLGALEARLSIDAYCRNHPVTITGAGVLIPGFGTLTRSMQEVPLNPGDHHSFEFSFDDVENVLKQNPLARIPQEVVVEASGRAYKNRLGPMELLLITGQRQRGIRQRVTTTFNRLPWRRNKWAAAQAAIDRQWGQKNSSA
jgi:hypothetical protein